MSVRELLQDRTLLLVTIAFVAIFMTIGVLFRAPALREAAAREAAATTPSYEQLGLNAENLDGGLRLELPGILRLWNNQPPIGH